MIDGLTDASAKRSRSKRRRQSRRSEFQERSWEEVIVRARLAAISSFPIPAPSPPIGLRTNPISSSARPPAARNQRLRGLVGR